MQKVPLFAIFLAAMLLSGCFGDDDVKAGKDQEPVIAEEAVVTDATGSIKGQIITVDLEPVHSATAGLTRGGEAEPILTTTTDTQGRFTLNGVEPGGYRLHIASTCCVAAAKEVVVSAGQVSEIFLQVERVINVLPYVEEDEWQGFVSCGVGTPTMSPVLISAVTADCATAATDPNDDPALTFEVTEGLKSLVVGMTWDAAGGVSGERLMLHINKVTGDNHRYSAPAGPAPLLENIDDTDVPEDDEHAKFAKISETQEQKWELQFRVWTPWDEPSFNYQQPFKIYWQEYYRELAPEGANPVPDQ